MNIQILHRADLPLGGFAGLKEYRLIVDNQVGGGNDTWNGIGNFVYLADAQFLPKGETRLHTHKEIDVISIMVDGRVVHEGSLEHGKSMLANQAQAQRAGGEGFAHNEVNPDNQKNRMLQLWVLPETKGEPADYKFYDLGHGMLSTIYGGVKAQTDTLDSHTLIETGVLDRRQSVTKSGEFLVYIATGGGCLNTINVQEGDLIRGQNLSFTAANDDTLVVVVTVAEF